MLYHNMNVGLYRYELQSQVNINAFHKTEMSQFSPSLSDFPIFGTSGKQHNSILYCQFHFHVHIYNMNER